MSQLKIEQVQIAYARQTIVQDMTIVVEDGQIGCLLGPSGCGKTTLLRAIAGFEPITAGHIYLNGDLISSSKLHLPPEKRNIGMVFQDYALFPHLTIADNITFGISRASHSEKKQRVAQLLELVNLPRYEKRYPHELSGGQQQRIALARALAPRPRLLLLDEPFGSQDVELREILAREVRDILRHEGTTAVLVTHDQHEAFAMADQIGVMKAGRLQQWDNAYNLYHEPHNAFVAEFIGQGMLLSGQRVDDYTIRTPLGIIKTNAPTQHEAVNILIRPDDVRLVAQADYQATVLSRVFRGAAYLYTLLLPDQQSTILALAPSHQVYDVGATVQFELDMQHLVVLAQGEALG